MLDAVLEERERRRKERREIETVIDLWGISNVKESINNKSQCHGREKHVVGPEWLHLFGRDIFFFQIRRKKSIRDVSNEGSAEPFAVRTSTEK